jgi:AraC family transcriptional regulator
MVGTPASSPLSPAEWIKLMPRAPVLSSADLDWVRLQAYHFTNPRHWQLDMPALDSHFIVAHLSNPCELSTRWNGLVRRGRSIPGNIMIMSSGQPSSWEWTGEIDELHLFLDTQAFSAAAQELSDRSVGLVDGLGIIDPFVLDVAVKVNAELASPGAGSRLFGDALAQILVLQLLRRHSTLPSASAFERLDIPTHKLRAALDFMDAHLDEDITLESIAAAARMSTFRFARGFKKAVGRAPYQYVIERRLERAKELLRTTREPIANIAASVGFATQSHFTASFRRRFGATPKQYRDTARA